MSFCPSKIVGQVASSKNDRKGQVTSRKIVMKKTLGSSKSDACTSQDGKLRESHGSHEQGINLLPAYWHCISLIFALNTLIQFSVFATLSDTDWNKF